MKDIEWTEKGTLFSRQYNDVYFSDGEGLNESKYVFLESNSVEEKMQSGNTVVGELGFGTGLNFLLTWDCWRQTETDNRLIYISCEKHPLSSRVLEECHQQFPQLSGLSAQLCSKWPATNSGFRFIEFEEGNVCLLLLLGDAYEMLSQLQAKIDIWYLDGFSPSENPDMWSENIFKQLAWHSHNDTSLATYTAAGFVRRGLEAVGFEVQKVKGFGNKLHMTVGRYSGFVKKRMGLKPWFQPQNNLKPQSVAVIGAGMAGLNCAYAFSRLGLKVTVYDKNPQIASGASGNKKGLMYSLISKKSDRLGRFTEAGAFYSFNQFRDLGLDFTSELLEFAHDQSKQQRLQEGISRFDDRYAEYLPADKVGEYLGFEADIAAVLHKRAASISPLEYAEALVEKGGFTLCLGDEINNLVKKDKWQLTSDSSEELFDIVIIASAWESQRFLKNVPLRKTRGQLIYVDNEQLSPIPKLPMNFTNYLIPDKEKAVLGATFQIDDDSAEVRDEDCMDLIDSTNKIFPGLIKSPGEKDYEGRVSFRAVLKDFLPVVGQVPEWDDYFGKYRDLVYGKPDGEYSEADYQCGLYSCCGFGSRGLTTAAYSAAFLARLAVDGVSILPVEHFQAVHPGRFVVRDFKKGLEPK